MSVVFFGTPRFAIPALETLINSGEQVLAVVTQPDKKQGRGHALLPPPVKVRAMEADIRVLQPQTLKHESIAEELLALKPDFFVVVAYGKILSQAVLDIPSIAPVNIHASLLPRYRGAAPIAWAVLDCLKETGITTMLMSAGLDEGDMLLSESCRIMPDDTAQTLADRLSLMGGPLLIQTLSGLRDGSIRPVPQQGVSSYARQLKKEDGRIDWTRTARELDCHVRGMMPWPVAFFIHEGHTVKVLRARKIDGVSAGPAVVNSIMASAIIVGTGQGGLELIEVQPEGKRPMSGQAYAAGRRIKEGARLE